MGGVIWLPVAGLNMGGGEVPVTAISLQTLTRSGAADSVSRSAAQDDVSRSAAQDAFTKTAGSG